MKKLEMIKTYYECNMAKDLPEYGILGWESEEAQRLRFDVLLDKVKLDGKKLLDVGCGTGNLIEHINSRGLSVEYTGVDILEQMIEKANKKNLDAVFIHTDIFKENIFSPDSFDVVYTSGIFNLNLGNNREFLKDALALFFSLSREAVVFNLLHVDSPDREEKYFYFHPDEVSGILTEFSAVIKQVEIIETYLKNDFTLICEKNK
ncbi:MAG: class I SAM-dependent methyltransferase [Clostridiaceae bacterium]|jgi:SAM-dependent methyltransferase|nr:class I SAM-dependent methyltransferase [Clostridiaceae bacterium]